MTNALDGPAHILRASQLRGEAYRINAPDTIKQLLDKALAQFKQGQIPQGKKFMDQGEQELRAWQRK